MNESGTVEIKDRRSGRERRMIDIQVDSDRRREVRRRNDSIRRIASGGLQLKQEVTPIDEATIDTPLTEDELAVLKKLNERRAYQMQGVRSGTQRHEDAVNRGEELAFHQMPQGGYPTSQKNLHS